jgi:conjugative transposon TraM protein
MKKVQTQKFLRKRKFMLMLPLLTIPFITLAVWAVSLGNRDNNNSVESPKAGLNLMLPEAKLAFQQNENKLSFYDKAKEDSIKLQLEKSNDPYYKNGLDTLDYTDQAFDASAKYSSSIRYNDAFNSPSGLDSNEEKIYERLDALKKIIEQPQPDNTKTLAAAEVKSKSEEHSDISHDVDRLQSLIENMTSKDSLDPEMKQINEVLDKIIAIQKPETDTSLHRGGADGKATVAFDTNITTVDDESYLGDLMESDSVYGGDDNQFFDESSNADVSSSSNSVHAEVYSTQTVMQGSTMKLRITEDAYLKGTFIAAGSFVYGTASLDNERLLIDVPGIRVEENIIALPLAVYDLDGLPGIYIPGSMSRDVLKQSADQSLQSIQLLSLDPSLKAQATSAGIQTAKSLLSKKARAIKVTVTEGYEVLLKEVH